MENKVTNEFNRKLFLDKVITEFINKSNYRSLKTAFDGHIYLINTDKDPNHKQQNEEKRKILEKCFELFNDSAFKKKVQEIRDTQDPKPQILARAISNSVSERILGDRKRKYNMSDKYSEEQLTPNSTSFIPVDGLRVTVADASGNNVIIQKIGTLRYGTPSVNNESVDKYRVTRTLSDSTVQEFEIFSYIDLNLLQENPDYCEAVLGELLSKNTVELTNACGYVGEIISTKHSQKQLPVGSQAENESKFYRYQVSQKYALQIDPQDLSAVVYHSRQQSLNAQKSKNETSSKDEMVQE